MSLFDTVSRIIREGKDMISNSLPANTYSYTKPEITPVLFGVPKAPLPNAPALPKTANTTRQPVATAPIKAVVPPPPIDPLEIIRRGKEQAYRQATQDPSLLQNSAAAKIPILGKILTGTGATNKGLYAPDTFAGSLERQGVAGFLLQGFKNLTNPDRTRIGEQIYADYQTRVRKGEDPETALKVATQNLVNKKTPNFTGVKRSIDEMQAPGIELSLEQSLSLLPANLGRKAMAVIDAPGFGATIKPAKGVVSTILKNEELDIAEKAIDIARGTSKLDKETQKTVLQQAQNIADREKFPNRASGNKGLANDFEQALQNKPTPKKDTPAQEGFKNFADLSTKLLGKLEGKGKVSKQYIADLTNSPDLKQAERDMIRKALETEGDNVDVTEFANKVKTELLPLTTQAPEGLGYSEGRGRMVGRYENINLPDELRGPVANYEERVYESPIKTSAGDVHFSNDTTPNYFAHSRVEDLPDKQTRRVIEAQSDLFQKGRLESEFKNDTIAQRNLGIEDEYSKLRGRRDLTPKEEARVLELEDQFKNYKSPEQQKLEPYRNTWHERVVREEVKKAAMDGKTKLQFPTGETAMKIEGLGQAQNNWSILTEKGTVGAGIKPENLKVGMPVTTHPFGMATSNDSWIITDVLGDGKFKAVPKSRVMDLSDNSVDSRLLERARGANYEEQFDISGKVDTNNPIYKFYEKEMGKYLKNRYGAERVTDAQGVSWYEVDLTKKNYKDAPVEAYAGAVTGVEQDEEGNIKFDPLKAVAGMAGLGVAGSLRKTKILSKTTDGNLDSYIKSNIANRENARGTSSFYAKLKEIGSETGKKFIDYTLPIGRAVEKGKKEDPFFRAFLEKNPSKDVNNQIDRVLRAPTIATQFIKDNGLSQVVKEVDNLDEFDEYLIASHAIDVDARGINTGRNVKRDEQIVRYLAPRYEKQAKVVRAYSQKLLDEATNAGLISKETNTLLKERYPNYVPLNRIFDEAELANQRAGNGKGVASLSKQTVVRKLEGSSREIESPIRSLYERTNSAVLQIEKNQAAKLIGSYEKIKGNPFHLTEIQDVGAATKDMGTISFLDNGVKRIFETTPEIADAAKALNIEQLNILVRILAVPTRLLRLGATGVNTAFLGANIVKDQISAFIMADKGMRASIANPNNFIKGLWSAVGRNEMYDEWIRAGGGGTAYDLGRNQIKSTVERDRAKRTLLSRGINAGKNPLRTVEDLFARAEEITRLQQYRAARDIATEKGLLKVDSTTAGASASRENSVNFARRGEWGSVLNATIPYFGASIQGSRLLVRNLKNKPLQTSTKIATTLLFPTAMATYWNMSDPIRKEVYDDIQDYEKEGNIILVPHNPIKDEQGRWEVIKIPLPPGVGQLAGLVRRPIEQTYGLDAVKFKEVAKALVKTVSPVDFTSGRGILSSLTPQIIKPSLESVTNTNLFTGKPIVYPNEALKPPAEQVRDYTSGTARLIAKGLGTSPIKTEAFIGSAGAGVAKNALNLSDKALAALGIIPKDQIGGVGIGESVSRRFTSAAGNKYRGGSRELDAALKEEETTKKETSSRLSASLAEFSGLTPDEQAAKLKELAQTDKEYALKLRDKLREENKKKSWSDVDKGIAQLGVENKARATYVYKKMKELPNDQRNAYIKDLHDRKVISDTVMEQLREMHKENAIIE